MDWTDRISKNIVYRKLMGITEEQQSTESISNNLDCAVISSGQTIADYGSSKFYEIAKDGRKQLYFEADSKKPWQKTSSTVVSFLTGTQFIAGGYYPLPNKKYILTGSTTLTWEAQTEYPGYGTLKQNGSVIDNKAPKCMCVILCGGGGGGGGHSWFYSGSGGGGGGTAACVIDFSSGDSFLLHVGTGGSRSYNTSASQTGGDWSYIQSVNNGSYVYASGGNASSGNANFTHGSGGAGGGYGKKYGKDITNDSDAHIYYIGGAGGGSGGNGGSKSASGGSGSSISVELGNYGKNKSWSSSGSAGGTGSYGGGGGGSALGNGGYGAGRGGDGGAGGNYGGGGAGGGLRIFYKGYGGNGANGVAYLIW